MIPAPPSVGARTHRRTSFLYRQKYAAYALFVLFPTVLTATYYFLLAGDQYQSEAHFFVVGTAGADTSSTAGSGGISGSTPSASVAATMAVVDYLQSHDARRDLEKKLDLVAIYRRPEADWFARVSQQPSTEQLDKYLFTFPGFVSAYLDISQGVAVLKVRAFRAEDARNVAQTLLDGADRLVDGFGRRIEEDTLRVAHSEVGRAQAQVETIQDKLTAFRLHEQSVDPTKSAQTVLEVVGGLEDKLSQAESDLVASQTYLQQDSPRFAALQNQVNALKSQIVSERSRLTGADGSLTPTLADYSKLMLEQDFAQKDYQSALAGLELARIQADRQHMYLVQVVEPNVPQDAEFPRAWYNVMTVFVTLSVCYGIGWLIVAGVKEHAG